MKIAPAFVLLLSLPPLLFAYTKDPDSGLLFNETKYQLSDAPDAQRYKQVQSALLVAPDDLPERKHHSNSSMARVELLVLAPGGSVQPQQVNEDACEQIFIVLEGDVAFTAGGEELKARRHDIVFIAPGLERSFRVTGEKEARVIQADWREKGAKPASSARAFIVSEKLRPLEHTGGEGYVTVGPNARQQGNALSIVSYGAGHVNASNSLLLYPQDITTERTFKANTHLARMGLSQYHPGGGTRWHFHPDREQCFVILSGKGLVEIGANTVEVKAGDIVFAPRHVGHGYKTTGAEPFKFLELEWGRD
jgi:mannose-6-phosphate isomerase-like protein (cupin superfamily)